MPYAQVTTSPDGNCNVIVQDSLHDDAIRVDGHPLSIDVSDDPRYINGHFLFDWHSFYDGAIFSDNQMDKIWMDSLHNGYHSYRIKIVSDLFGINYDINPDTPSNNISHYNDAIKRAWNWMLTHNVGAWFGNAVVIAQDGSNSFIANDDHLSISMTRGIIDKGLFSDPKNIKLWFPLFVKNVQKYAWNNSKATKTALCDDDSDFYNGVAL